MAFLSLNGQGCTNCHRVSHCWAMGSQASTRHLPAALMPAGLGHWGDRGGDVGKYMVFLEKFSIRAAAVHGVAKSQARLNDFTFTFHFHALEKEMATHSSVLASY